MNETFKDVYLVWKSSASEDRFLIGLVSREAGQVTFRYDPEEVQKASRSGFRPYIEFNDIYKVYDQYVTEIFSQRLTPKSRYKTAVVFKFWEISEEILKDQLATIAFTQAMLPTDNFEFLADFFPIKGLAFISDLQPIKSNVLPGQLLEVGDSLTWHINQFDTEIFIKYENMPIGYVKKIHSNVFRNYKGSIRLRVYSIESRETIKRIFVKIELT